MEFSIYCGISAVVCWYLALSFLPTRRAVVIKYVIPAGVLSFVVTYLLSFIHVDFVFLPAQIMLFCLISFIFYFGEKCPWRDIQLAFLLALAQFTLFIGAQSCWITVLPSSSSLGITLMPCLHAIAILYLRPHFPKPHWREAFNNPKKKRIASGEWMLYVIPACLIVGFMVCWFPVSSNREAAIVTMVGESIFWGYFLLMILFIHYRMAQSSSLVEKQFRREMQLFMNVIRSQRHDYNFHVQAITGLVRSQRWDECMQYVDALEKSTTEMNAVLLVKEPAISAMIHHFQKQAMQDGIRLQVEIEDDLSKIATDVYETNKIIGNLLQNALDETRTHKDKSYGIRLLILKRNEYCVICVSNALGDTLSADRIGQIYQPGFTMKEGHEGVGLSSVRMLVESYQGMLNAQIEDGIITFSVRVPIRTV